MQDTIIDSWLQRNAEKIRGRILSEEISDIEMLEDYPDVFMYDFDEDVFPVWLQRANDRYESESLTEIGPYIEEAKRHGYSVLSGYPDIVGEHFFCVFEKDNLSFAMDEISQRWHLFTSYHFCPDCDDCKYDQYELHMTPNQLFSFLDEYISFIKKAVKKWRDFYWNQEECRRECKQFRLSSEIQRRTIDESLGRELVVRGIPCSICADINGTNLFIQIGDKQVAYGGVTIEDTNRLIEIICSDDEDYRMKALESLGFSFLPMDETHAMSFAEYQKCFSTSHLSVL